MTIAVDFNLGRKATKQTKTVFYLNFFIKGSFYKRMIGSEGSVVECLTRD